MIKKYDFLKTQGINCLFLVNACADLENRVLVAGIGFIPPRIKSDVWVTNGNASLEIKIPIEQQNLAVFGRKLKVQYQITNYRDSQNE